MIAIENGSSWVKPLMKAAALGRTGAMVGGMLPNQPSEALAQHLWLSPFPEDDVPEVIGLLGAEHVLFGSDYPHPEGLRLPRDIVPLLDGCSETVKRKVLRSNTASLVRLTAQWD